MTKINIVHLTYRRKNFAQLSHYLLSKCKFKDFNITLCSFDQDENETKDIAKYAESLGLKTSIITVPSAIDNYMNKVTQASNMPYEYSIKMDEDIFLGPQAWDFLFENIHLLDNEENILIAPTLSTGIPTCDDFIEHNFSEEEKINMYKIFSNTNMLDCWGVNYSELRKLLLNNGYITDDYYNNVRNLNHFYKGIHPIRVGIEAIKYMNNLIVNKMDMFFENRDFFIKEISRPYFCNSFFAIKTNTWKKIIDDKSLFMDAFDEVAINNYRNRTGKKFLSIPNAFGIHTLYNTLHCDVGMSFEDMDKMEQDFFNKINEKIKLK